LRKSPVRNVLADLKDGSVNCIVTDPPYLKEYLDCWRDLGALASRVLADDVFLVSYSGHMFLPQIMTALGTHLEYYWTLALVHRGPRTSVQIRQFTIGWKPVVVYARCTNRRRARWSDDVIWGEGPEKHLHAWQQGESEAAWLVERFSNPGDMVLDPFVGSGTTAAAAVRLGRRFIGCDINPAAVATAQERLRGVTQEGVAT
jgi:16S rRNA G966 N2-methylase RsmD